MTRPVHAILIAGDDIDADGKPVSGTPAPGAPQALDILELDLRNRFTKPDVTRLQNGPTRAKVVEAFVAMRVRASPGELFVVMFAGHGDRRRGPQPGQRWFLTGDQWFEDDDLIDQLLEVRDGVDAVVISDCCYGAGFFQRGAMLPGYWPPQVGNTVAAGAPSGLTLTDGERKLLLDQSRALGEVLSATFKNRKKDSPMVCISAAGKDRQVAQVEVPHLAKWTTSAADADDTYADLKRAFAAHPAAGAAFQVDARPTDRYGERVLGV